MSAARDDYPDLAFFASGASGGQRPLIERRRESAAALNEIDRLRSEVSLLKLRVPRFPTQTAAEARSERLQDAADYQQTIDDVRRWGG